MSPVALRRAGEGTAIWLSGSVKPRITDDAADPDALLTQQPSLDSFEASFGGALRVELWPIWSAGAARNNQFGRAVTA